MNAVKISTTVKLVLTVNNFRHKVTFSDNYTLDMITLNLMMII
jgi:hypothetical protein